MFHSLAVGESRGYPESVSISPRTIRGKPSDGIHVREYQPETDPTVLVKRYSMESPPKLVDIPDGDLSGTERNLFTLALQELASKDSAQVYLKQWNRDDSPNNVVLVDVVVRNGGVVQEGYPQRKTVCLWKTGDNEFVLIDPITASENGWFQDRLQKTFSDRNVTIKIISYLKDAPFYALFPLYCQPGTQDNDSRDGIDIAVKIAFKLNEEQRSAEDEDLVKIEDSIRTLSNRNQVNTALGVAELVVMRGLQSSDSATRENYVSLLERNKEYLKTLKIENTSSLLKLDQLTKAADGDFLKKFGDYQVASTEEKLECLNSLVSGRGALNYEEKGPNRYTNLHLAVHGGHVSQVESLLKTASNLAMMTDIYGQTALHWVAGKDHCEEEKWLNLIDLFAQKMIRDYTKQTDFTQQSENNKYTALHFAVHCGNYRIAQKLLEHCSGLANLSDVHGQTALHWIAGKDNREEGESKGIVKSLVGTEKAPGFMDNGGLCHQTNVNKYTAMHLAVQSGNTKIIKKLAKRCSNLTEITDVYGQTPLHWIAGKGDGDANWLETVQLLVAKMMHKWTLATNGNNYTTLHLAVQSGNIQIAGLLLDSNKGVLGGIPDARGQTPLHWVASKSRNEEAAWGPTIDMLLEKMSEEDVLLTTEANHYTALHLAVHSGNSEVISKLVTKYPEIAKRSDLYAQTALHWIAGKDHNEEQFWLPTVTNLLRVMPEASVRQVATTRCTALDYANSKDNLGIARLIRGFLSHE